MEARLAGAHVMSVAERTGPHRSLPAEIRDDWQRFAAFRSSGYFRRDAVLRQTSMRA